MLYHNYYFFYNSVFIENTTVMEKMSHPSVNVLHVYIHVTFQSMKVHSVTILLAQQQVEKGCYVSSRLHGFGIMLQLLSSGAAQEEHDQLRPAQKELMTPESTSSVFPLWTNTAGAHSRLLLSCCSCITTKICLQQPAALHTSHCKDGWGNSYCVMYTCKIWQVRLKKKT